ncbi:MAG: hypothetical protein Q9213_001420 [Squamulea squamosa]
MAEREPRVVCNNFYKAHREQSWQKHLLVVAGSVQARLVDIKTHSIWDLSGAAQTIPNAKEAISLHATSHAKREEVSSKHPFYISAAGVEPCDPGDADQLDGPSYSIAFCSINGLSQYHHPTFDNYDWNATGNWTNWGHGPAFTLEHPPDDYTNLPTMKWDNETAYLKGWYIHAPAYHSVDGDRSKAEMLLVHVDDTGHEVAVLAIRLDPGTSATPFSTQLPEMVPSVTSPGGSPSQGPPPEQMPAAPGAVEGSSAPAHQRTSAAE